MRAAPTTSSGSRARRPGGGSNRNCPVPFPYARVASNVVVTGFSFAYSVSIAWISPTRTGVDTERVMGAKLPPGPMLEDHDTPNSTVTVMV